MARPRPAAAATPAKRRGGGSAEPLGEAYFTRYGTGDSRTDYSRSWKRFTFSVPAILRVYRERYGRMPATLLDLGAADGSLMREAMALGLKARGVENSPYILSRVRDPKLRRLIRRADAADFVRDLKPGSFDVIVECTAQYLPPRRLARYLRNVARALSPAGMACLLVDPRGYQGDRSPPHAGVRTYDTVTGWRRRMREAGFARREGEFYFFRE